jgi:hypothetical protein
MRSASSADLAKLFVTEPDDVSACMRVSNPAVMLIGLYQQITHDGKKGKRGCLFPFFYMLYGQWMLTA